MTSKTETVRARAKSGKRVTIREARSDDDYHRAYPVIRQLIVDLDMQTYARRVFVARATGYRMFMAELNGNVIGVIGIVQNHNLHDGFVTYIEHVVIDEEYRGDGFGTALIQFAESRAREEGCKIIELDTDLGHDAAERLYLRNGYVTVGKYHHKLLEIKANDKVEKAEKAK